ncbi:hypothetical protein P8452_12464 [Trifolium repens]|nr:hypothetical protein P8452_12464 [Trifolium repens]
MEPLLFTTAGAKATGPRGSFLAEAKANAVNININIDVCHVAIKVFKGPDLILLKNPSFYHAHTITPKQQQMIFGGWSILAVGWNQQGGVWGSGFVFVCFISSFHGYSYTIDHQFFFPLDLGALYCFMWMFVFVDKASDSAGSLELKLMVNLGRIYCWLWDIF